MISAKKHYNMLIDENNDPVLDTEPLKSFMDKWDGKIFIDKADIHKTDSVLEIGVGTGRIAMKTAPLCKKFTGIDFSEKTAHTARKHLGFYENTEIICADFMKFSSDKVYDVIYSSLTFMHIRKKQKAINKIFGLLKSGGRFILSTDKNQRKILDYGDRKIKIFPDDREKTEIRLKQAGFEVKEIIETENAFIFVSNKL